LRHLGDFLVKLEIGDNVFDIVGEPLEIGYEIILDVVRIDLKFLKVEFTCIVKSVLGSLLENTVSGKAGYTFLVKFFSYFDNSLLCVF